MSFTETQEKFGDFNTIVVTDTETNSKITIIPEMGAILNSFKVNKKGQVIDIIDGHTNVEDLMSEYYSKGSLLAPFPNRISDGKYEFEGVKYSLPINKADEHNAIHGFVSNNTFELLSSKETDSGYELVLQSNSGITEGYPFPFKIVVTYIFKGFSLSVKTEISNTGTKQMPIGFGWHPYFTFGTDISEVSLQLPAVEEIIADERLIPTGDRKEYTNFQNLEKIGETEFDTGFKFLGANKEIKLSDDTSGMTMCISCTGQVYEYVQIFIPPWRKSIAIEPMTCAANAFNNKMGVTVLQSGETLSAEYTIKVDFS